MKSLKYLFFLFTFACSSVAHTQITGTITNEYKQPVMFASVKLLSSNDSTFIRGVKSSESGAFSFQKTTFGKYILQISSPDFPKEKWLSIDYFENPTKLEVELKASEFQQLEEVTVAVSTDVLEAGIDKKIYTTSNDANTVGGTANDVLNNIPSVEIDESGNITLRGDGNVRILIDGRPSAMAQGDGQNQLDAIPASSIERVEIVTNPSAKYDADGTAGIINIVMKKNRKKGFNGVVSAAVGTNDYYNGNLGLSFRGKKANVYGNYSFNAYNGFRNYRSDTYNDFETNTQTLLNQTRTGVDKKQTHSLLLGSDFYFSKQDVVGVSINSNYTPRTRTGELYNKIHDASDSITDFWKRNSSEPRYNFNLDLGANYKRTFQKKKGSWTTAVNHSWNQNEVEGGYEESYFLPTGEPSGKKNLNQTLDNATKMRLLTAQSDAYLIFEKKIKARVDFGVKGIFRNENLRTESKTKDTISGTYALDTLSNFVYQYDENVISGYATWGHKIGKFNYQIGVRPELAVQNPILTGNPNNYRNIYFNLYPSGHIKYLPSKKVELSLGYSRRINRPRSRQLNPFKTYANPLNLRSGNPALTPEYINSFDFGFSYTEKKVVVSTSLFHKRTKDVINRIKYYYDNGGSLVTYENVDRSEQTGIELVLIVKPWSWFKATLSGNGTYINYRSNSANGWNNSGFNWRAKSSLRFTFWKKTMSVQVNYNHNAPRVTPQGIVQRPGGLDIALEKSFFKKKLTIATRVSDLFNQVRFTIDFDQVGIRQDAEFKWLSRRLYFSLTYRFGSVDKRLKVQKMEAD